MRVFRWFQILCLLVLPACEDGRSFDLARGGAPAYADQADPQARDAAAALLSEAMLRGTRSYRLEPGDVVEVMFTASRQPSLREYRIGVGDEIEVDFLYRPQMTKTYLVRPDGRISLPLRSDLAVAGKRPADLAREITALYSDLYVDPTVTVNLRRASSESDDFLAMLSSSNGPRAQSIPVAPDGTLRLPMLRSIQATGRTVDDLAEIAERGYAERFGNISTTMRLSAVSNQQVFVFGEVAHPGPVPASRARSVLQLIAASGGPTEFAAMESVRVLYWDAAGQAHIRQANMDNVLNKLSLDEDMAVPANAVVFVPPTRLAKAGRMMDQVLRRLFMYGGASLGIQYNLGATALAR